MPPAEASHSQPASLGENLPRSSLSAPIPPTGGTRVNVNTASRAQLQALPGIGPALASRIARYRETYGTFHAPEDLLKVEGIGQGTLERIRPLITCGTQ